MSKSFSATYLIFFYFALFFFSCDNNTSSTSIHSPSENIKIHINCGKELTYEVKFDNKVVIKESLLGINFKNGKKLFVEPDIVNVSETRVDYTWNLLWGEEKRIRNHYIEKTISIENRGNKLLIDLVFRAYDDGIAFRYNIKNKEGNNQNIVITDEITQFNLIEDAEVWWTPAYGKNRYEELYHNSTISKMDSSHTPLTIRYSDGVHISIHEANLIDYSSMQIFYSNKNKLNCDLAPWSNGDKVRLELPFQTPWRTVIITNSAKELITSYLTLNCNESRSPDDFSWVRPSKYIGIWWGMILGKWTWGEGPKHGATMKRSKNYIDFAHEHGFDEVLIEGWQSGFEGWFGEDSVTVSFTKTTSDFNLEEVQEYALSKGVSLQGYHETSAGTKNYLAQIDSAFSLLNKLEIKNVKIGQVGSLLDNSEYHYGQYGVNYFRKVLQKASEYKLGVNFHEPVKDTGERRKYPNMLTREGARGMEFNAWIDGNPPNHTTILPFTRLLSSPMDFTPGIFDLKFENIDADLELEFPVTFTVIDSGNGYDSLLFVSGESYWRRKSMTLDTTHYREKLAYVWEIEQMCQVGEWEWGVVADHSHLKSYNIWLPELLGNEKNLKFEVLPNGSIKGQTKIVLQSNQIDFANIYYSKTNDKVKRQRVSTTLAKQLALYVVIYSPLQMASDFIENYYKNSAFNFIKDVPVSWDSTVVINGEIGEFITIARKDRESKDWYLGSITNKNDRAFKINLSFLDKGEYKATIYKDGESSDWVKNPYEYVVENKFFSRDSTHLIDLARGGGQAIKFEYITDRNTSYNQLNQY